MTKSSNKKQLGVVLRAGGDFYGPGKPEFATSDIKKQPGNEKPLVRRNSINSQSTSQIPPERSLESKMQEFFELKSPLPSQN